MARTCCGLVGVDQQAWPAGVHVVAEQRRAAGPLPLAPCGRDLVPGPLADDLPLELGEGQQHVQHQPAHAEWVVLNCWVTETKETPCWSNICIMRAKSSRERDRRSTLYTTTQSTLPASMSASRRAQGRPFDVAAGEPAVVVAVGQGRPPQRQPRRRPLPTGPKSSSNRGLFPWQVSRDVDFGCGDVGQSGGAG